MQSAEAELLEKPASSQTRAGESARALDGLGAFARRHIGGNPQTIGEMLKVLGFDDLDALIDATVPANIRIDHPLALPGAASEREALEELRGIARKNKVARSFIGAGYSDTITPPVIQRNILENPGWYTAYTPYQAEIAQGRLEALLNFQTMITDLTGFDIANASLLDEATAAAEAMALCAAAKGGKPESGAFYVSEKCHPQTIEVVRTRARSLGIKVVVGDHRLFDFETAEASGSRADGKEPELGAKFFGALVQYPATDGVIYDYGEFVTRAHATGALVVVAADLLALTLLRPPGEFDADVAIGSTQRFGVPLGFGGPHAAYFATRDAYKRHMPGRLVGVSHDAAGRPAYRLALQTREQHIRRDKATSNICTAQVLLAVIASMYAVYHGPRGLLAIAEAIHEKARLLAAGLHRLGHPPISDSFFDTVCVHARADGRNLFRSAEKRGLNFRVPEPRFVCIALDETTTDADIQEIFASVVDAYPALGPTPAIEELRSELAGQTESFERRASEYLTHPVFNTHRTETEMLRYLRRLESRDLSLTTSMIPLGSCTMKLNATAEMFPLSWPEFANLHPFAPENQSQGYRQMATQLEEWLAEITGFAAVSLQPNAGSQGEYAGLLAIREYHAARNEAHRDICLIPQSAHGTNPASAVMAGFRVVPVVCLKHGDIDLADLRAKADTYGRNLAALMVTYPSTHGVFETTIREVCEIVHQQGGQVYMDGANMNAQVGLCRPGDIGADVCHLNLHKTFCIPHGGGGPGVGPIGVADHLVPFLPTKEVAQVFDTRIKQGPVETLRPIRIAAAPYGSASILTISWMYIRMMGAEGLTEATKAAVLNANYMAKRLDDYFPVLFKGKDGLVAHECILDLRPFKAAGVEVEDVAKRLMDYGFHAPTVSWPVAGTMMVEPTESESKAEIDRFCEAMISIRGEIDAISAGESDRTNNPLKNAPHTAEQLAADHWDHPYSREQAAYPAPWTREHKFWPASARIDNVYGDRNLFCSCVPVEEAAPASSL